MFLAVSTHQEGRDVNHLSTRSIVRAGESRRGRGEWTSPSHSKSLVRKRRSMISADVCFNT